MASNTQVEDAINNYKTAPFDARFPNQNQSKNCWQNYVDFHRCQKTRGEDYKPCDWFKKVYKSICPNDWVEDWDSKMEEQSFPLRY